MREIKSRRAETMYCNLNPPPYLLSHSPFPLPLPLFSLFTVSSLFNAPLVDIQALSNNESHKSFLSVPQKGDRAGISGKVNSTGVLGESAP